MSAFDIKKNYLNFISSASLRLVGVAATYFLAINLVRLITVIDFGNYSLMLTLISSAITLSSLGFHVLIFKVSAIYYPKRINIISNYINSALFYSLAMNFLSALVFFIFWNKTKLNISYFSAIFFVLASFFGIFNLYFAEYSKGCGNNHIGIIGVNIIQNIGLLIFIYYFFYKEQLNFEYLSLSYLLSVAITSIFFIINSGKVLDYKKINYFPIKALLIKSLPFLFLVILFNFYDSVGIWILSLSGDMFAVGIYAFCFKMATFLSVLSVNTLAISMPKLVKFSKEKNIKKLNKLLHQTTFFIFTLTFIVATLIFLFPIQSINLLSSKYTSGDLTLRILLLSQMICIIYTPAFQVLQMTNDTRWANTIFSIGIILFISTAYFLAPKFGSVGLAVSQLVSSLYIATNTFNRYRKKFISWPFPTNLNFIKI